MAFATTAAIVAGGTAAASYLEAKYHLSKDINALYQFKTIQREYARAVEENRQSCYYFFEDTVRRYPDAVAIWSRLGEYTWLETNARVNQYAAFFLEAGVRPGQIVAFYLQNAPEFFFAWLGLWAIGCAPAMINCNLSRDALVHCLKISGASIVLIDEEETCKARILEEKQRMEINLAMKVVELSTDLKMEIAAKDAPRISDDYRKDVKGNFPIAIFYTSGTTGLPKGCAFTTERLFPTAASRSSAFGLRRGTGGDRFYNCMPFYHGTGGVSAMTNLINGISTAIGRKFSVKTFWKDVRDSESTWIVYVGETARYLLAAPPHPLDKEHKVRCMFGNGMRPDVWLRFCDRFGVSEVAEFFNSSEGVFTAINYCRGDYLVNAVGHHGGIMRFVLRNKFLPVHFDQETNAIVRDSKTGFAKRKSYEEGGEIIVKLENGAGFQGYWNDTGSTIKKLERDVLEKGDLYYRTGDALRRTPDGRWFFVDRLGDTFRWKSENVSTAEVAEIVGTFPGILEANVYGVSVPGSDGRAGCAAISIAPEQQHGFDWASLARFLDEKLPNYAVPVFIRILNGDISTMGSHNNKQIKGPLREEGANPDLKGEKVTGGKDDQLLWLPPKGGSYVEFRKEDWINLTTGKARL